MLIVFRYQYTFSDINLMFDYTLSDINSRQINIIFSDLYTESNKKLFSPSKFI